MDDCWSKLLDIDIFAPNDEGKEFVFLFYDGEYKYILVNSNGGLVFYDDNLPLVKSALDKGINLLSEPTSNSVLFCPYATSQAFPDSRQNWGSSSYNQQSPVLNSVNGPYGDIHYGMIANDSTKGCFFNVIGEYPYRKVIVSFNQIPNYGNYGSSDTNYTTSMIVLNETTNIIDFYIEHKAQYYSCNNSNAILGIQNIDGTAAHTITNYEYDPDSTGVSITKSYNNTAWKAHHEAWSIRPSDSYNYSVAWFKKDTQGNLQKVSSSDSLNIASSDNNDWYYLYAYITVANNDYIVLKDSVTVSYDSSLPPGTSECGVITLEVYDSICSGEQYTFYSNQLTQSGVYYDTVKMNNGIDTVVKLTLTVWPNEIKYETAAICDNSSYLFNGNLISEAGVYTVDLQSIHGCDSTVILTLSTYETFDTTVNITICEGETYYVADKPYNQSGVYQIKLPTVNCCDSNITLVLNVQPKVINDIYQTICSGHTYNFAGEELSESGVYQYDTVTQTGCDSTAILHLTVNTAYDSVIEEQIYEGDVYVFGDMQLTEAGTYTYNFYTQTNCDSVITLILTVTESLTYETSDSGAVITGCNVSGDVVINDTVIDSNGNKYPVTAIADSAFAGNDNITSVTLPSTITQIGCGAFEGCTALDSLFILAENPPELCQGAIPGANTKSSEVIIVVPCGKLAAYKSAPVWKTYNIIENCNHLEFVDGNNTLQIYPNPAKDKVTIKADGDVTIFNNKGQTVKTINNINGVKEINIADLESGVYYIKVGETTKKLIIK